jgi:hypothetical protein
VQVKRCAERTILRARHSEKENASRIARAASRWRMIAEVAPTYLGTFSVPR